MYLLVLLVVVPYGILWMDLVRLWEEMNISHVRI